MFTPNPCATVHSLMKFSVWQWQEDDVMYGNDCFLLRLCGTQHRWLAGLEAYMPLTLISRTFVLCSRLWAQTELQSHTLCVKYCISQIIGEIQRWCSQHHSLNLRKMGNRRGWEENVQWLAPVSAFILLCVCAQGFIFQGNDLRSTSTCSNLHQQQNQLFWWMTLWGARWPYSTWITLPFLSCSAIFKCPSFPIPRERMRFGAYKGPQHWLNHLFRTHHLQGLLAITSFSDAPGAPGSAVSILAVRASRGGPAQTFQPCYWALLSQHITSPASSVLRLSHPCSTSGMRLLPNAGIRKEGGG